MARQFTCGFEEGNLLTAMWNTITGAPTIGFTGAPSGACLMNTSAAAGNSFASRSLSAAKTTGSLWTRFKWSADDATPSANTDIISDVSSGAVVTMQVRLLTSGVWSLLNALTTTEVTTTATAANGTVYRIETYHLLGGVGAGDMKARIYNNTTGALIEEIGLPTLENTLSSNVLTFRLGKTASTSTFSYDDFAINDESGSLQNSWPGAGKVALLAPTSNTSVTWLNEAGGAGSFTKIDEATGPFTASDFDGTSQYLTCADVAAHDLTAAGAFTIAAVVRTDSITGTHTFVAHDDAVSNFGWRFIINGAHLLLTALGQWGQNGTATTDLQVATWYGIAATRPAASTMVTYWRFNLGTQTMTSEAIDNFVSTYTDGTVRAGIGADFSAAGQGAMWDGKIARVGIDVGTAHTSQELTDFFNGAATTSWDSRWDLPTLTDTGTAGATLTNVGTLSNDELFNATTSTTNEDKFAPTSLLPEVPSNAVMTLIDVYARVSAQNGVSGTMALKVWDDADTGTQGTTFTVNSSTPRILTTAEHQVASLAGKTKNDIAGYRIGYKAVSAATSNKAVMALWANVEWTEFAGSLALTGSASTSARGTSVPGISVPL